ncbi:prenyltransferase [bacterium]|nr:prenyltransferase [bacterium]
MSKKVSDWAKIVRAQYMTLPVVLSIIGNALAYYEGAFQWGVAVLSFIGLMLAHMSVNVINDYFDFKSGIDQVVTRSPFNGGSGSIKDGIITTKATLSAGIALMAIAGLIGLFFMITVSWWLLPLILVAAFFIVAYSPKLLKIPFAEWSAGIGLGALPIIGCYFVQTGTYSWSALLVSIPSTILVHHLLLLNEIPDEKADRVGNRKTFPILFGKLATMNYYLILVLLMYLYIVACVIFHVFPVWSLVTLVTLPLVFKIFTLGSSKDKPFQPAQQMNVIHLHLTQLLFGLSFILGKFW